MKDEIKKDKDKQNGRDSVRSREKRARSPRRDRSRSPVDKSSRDSNKAQRRVYVANISFDTRWAEVKDFFRDKIGNVLYCKMFEDEEGRSRGCGLIEFKDTESAKRAIQELNRCDFKGRELVVKEDIDCERDSFGRLLPNKREKERDQRDGDRHNRQIFDPMRQTYSNSYNTYGLSPQFLESLNIRGPLNNRIFVANLDYGVTEKKLEEIFRLAGKVMRVHLYKDNKDSSKGYATVEFEHPVEAVQAISMFHDQNLFNRAMSIRMDKYEPEETAEVLPSKLPQGLDSIGKGLGVNGQPLNIGKSLLNAAHQQQSGAQSLVSSLASQTNSALNVAPQATTQSVAQPQVNYNLSGLTNALGQQQSVVGLNSNLAAPQTLNNSLSSLGLGSLNASTLSASLGAQNLTQLANTAQGVLAASLGNSMNPSLGLTSTQPQTNNLFSAYDRYDQSDKYRNGSIVSHSSTIQNQVQSPCSDKVIVRNLPLTFTWQNLKDRFQEIGDVRYCEIKNRGMAVIHYANYSDAARAVALMNGIIIENKQIEVGYYY